MQTAFIQINLKRLTLFCFFILTACISIENERASADVETEVLAAFNGLVEASRELDAERYFEYFDKEKFTGLNTDGSVWHSIENLEAIIVPAFSMLEKTISLEFDNVKVTVINQTTAILVNEYKHKIQLKNGEVLQQSGGGSQVWWFTNGSWKLVSVSASDSRL